MHKNHKKLKGVLKRTPKYKIMILMKKSYQNTSILDPNVHISNVIEASVSLF